MGLVSKLVFALSVLSLSAIAYPKYAMTVLERPLTMPKNSFETAMLFKNQNVMQLGLDYGAIDDYLQVGVFWNGFTVANEPYQGLSLNLASSLFFSKYVNSMAKLSMPFQFNNQVLREISLGTPLYVAVFPGRFNVVFFDDLLRMNWSEKQVAAQFAFGLRLSWQATRAMVLNLSSSFAVLDTAGSHKHIGMTSPLKLSALYSISPLFDVVGEVGYSDFHQSAFAGMSGLNFGLGILMRGGEIEG